MKNKILIAVFISLSLCFMGSSVILSIHSTILDNIYIEVIEEDGEESSAVTVKLTDAMYRQSAFIRFIANFMNPVGRFIGENFMTDFYITAINNLDNEILPKQNSQENEKQQKKQEKTK